MNAQDMQDFDAHEDVRLFELAEGGHAVIAIHSTYRGPAAGGCRVWRYRVAGQALTDALRLSRGMSFKNALADLPLGGGKSVIIPPKGPYDRVRLFESFGEAVESLGGRYVTAEDVGSSVADMQVVATRTHHVGGLPAASGRAGGDPSPWTALGVFLSLQAALDWKLGRPLAGASITVQGAGSVGATLCGLLAAAGASVTITDIDIGRAQAVSEATGAYLAAPDDIHRLKADAFAPCALGAGLNNVTLTELGASIVCGAANNQMADPAIGKMLAANGVLYCPDDVVNAGGIIAVHGESIGQSAVELGRLVEAIPGRLIEILELGQAKGKTPETVADEIALDRIGRGTAPRSRRQRPTLVRTEA